MKKTPLVMMTFILLFSALACALPVNLPFFNRTTEPVQEEPTSTPIPTSTPTQPAADVVDGFTVFADNGVEITLPSSFVLGDAERDLGSLLENMAEMGGDINIDIQDIFDENIDDVLLLAYGADNTEGRLASAVVMKNEEFARMSLGMISTFANVFLGEFVEEMTQDRMTLGNRDVLRFMVTAEIEGTETTQAVYLFKDSDKLWVIGFFSNQAELGDLLAIYDAAVESFTVVSVE